MQVSGQLHTPAALPPEKESLVPIVEEAGWIPDEEKNSQHLPGLEPPIIQPVAQRYVKYEFISLMTEEIQSHSRSDVFSQQMTPYDLQRDHIT
jgi:hypothetical protein